MKSTTPPAVPTSDEAGLALKAAPTDLAGTVPAPSTESRKTRIAFGRFIALVTLATLALGAAWMQLIRDAFADRLHSYALLIPFVSGWLVWQQRRETNNRPNPSVPLAGIAMLAAVTSAAMGGWAWHRDWITSDVTWLSTQLAAWVFAVWSIALGTFGPRVVRSYVFAAGFLAFTIPLPLPVASAIEIGLQYASAEVVDWVYRIVRQPALRDGLYFWLPGLRISVDQECSGIRSTLVLFITSVLGGYLLLRTPWRRAVIAMLVIPLGIFRNALRIVTLTLLSVHVDPRIIHSALHHRGGPLFFAVSLIPLFLLLIWFRRWEARHRPAPSSSRAATGER